MTRKELVFKHKPECIDDGYEGGVLNCPNNDMYEEFMPMKEIQKVKSCSYNCTKCWNTEIEEDTSNHTTRFIRKSTDNDKFYLNPCGENCQHNYGCEGNSPTEFICPSLQQVFEKLYKFEEAEERLFKKMNNILD